MVKKNYQEEADSKITAKAMMKNKGISLKYSTEICREIRGKPVFKAEKFLNAILDHRTFLPLKRYNKKVAHRKGQSVSGVKSGRFPKKACEAFLELLGYTKANAENKGLDSEKLLIRHCCGIKIMYKFVPVVVSGINFLYRMKRERRANRRQYPLL